MQCLKCSNVFMKHFKVYSQFKKFKIRNSKQYLFQLNKRLQFRKLWQFFIQLKQNELKFIYD